ncbi:16S rRNA (guanine(966)-N(2))-methyltransferase RsmD [Defluviitalea phaphyphila]|uniref:16S rRNA (guanine(966)-N(2))-methyltransferase RsmD n=1 Tax=Defluviitalea phaphyphila TaxID=1473580 RepID=UPI000731AB04|nr:16S rRNA (guanine(966)-N(2))-methyltransferase RsmD [Defluviitalea phaphyphila]
MRVIAGIAKGHNLKAPKGMETRPTTDRIKESLFNIISPDLYECSFLDLYSGTGAIGIEALSRGAKKAVFIDKSPICKKIIKENLLHTKLIDKAVIYQLNVNLGLDILKKNNEIFDIIFMDPPYSLDIITETLNNIAEYGILDKKGYVIIEHSSKKDIQIPDNFLLWKEKKYKTTKITFLKLLEGNI